MANSLNVVLATATLGVITTMANQTYLPEQTFGGMPLSIPYVSEAKDYNFNSLIPDSIEITYDFKTHGRKIDEEARDLFGIMRDETPEEQKRVMDYLRKISKDTGENFWDLC